MPSAIELDGYKSVRAFARAVGISNGKARQDLKQGFCIFPKFEMKLHRVQHPLWCTYQGMIQRCITSTNVKYHLYGGRGIKVCGAWLYSFERFVADVGIRPSADHSIDRIDSDGDYEPTNVRWATDAEQNANRRPYLMKHPATRNLLQEKHISKREHGYRVRFTSPAMRCSMTFNTLQEAITWRDAQLIGITSLLAKKKNS